MTQEEFQKVKDNFSSYKGKRVDYKRYWPSADKWGKDHGCLVGIGEGVNRDNLIVSWSKYQFVVHYTEVISIKDIV